MKSTFSVSLFLLGLLLGSCAKDKNTTPDIKPVAAQLSSVITKAVGTSWSANDKIGVFMTSNQTINSSTILDGADNISYQVASGGTNGLFTPSMVSKTIFLPQDDSKVTFIAYYPYSEVLNSYALNVNLTDQSNQEALDIMSASVGDISKTKPNVALQFARAMSKVIIKTSSSVYSSEQLAAMTVKITALNTTGTFSLSNRTITSTGTPASITAQATTAGSIYEAIMFPEDVASKGSKIEIDIDGKTLSYAIQTKAFVKGERYTYDLEVDRTGVISINTTITDWVDDPTVNNGTAE